MDDLYDNKLKPGDKGTVGFIDDTGTIFVTWDKGSSLGLVYGVDSYKMVEHEPNLATDNAAVRIAENKDLIRKCIDGLGVYAMIVAENDPKSHKITEISDMIGRMVIHWGLDSGLNAKSVEDYQDELKDKVSASAAGKIANDIGVDHYPGLTDGLYLHGKELIASQGTDAMGEILQVSDMLSDLADYSPYDAKLLCDMSGVLTVEVRDMLNNYDLPGQAMEADNGGNVVNYIVKQAVLFDNDRGFAYGHNPEAVSPYATWQFTNDHGAFDHYWGHYFGREDKALIDYITRAESYGKDHGLKEKELPMQTSAVEPDPENSEAKRLIRFIDSSYKELFQIPDGESIRIIYPIGDGREPVKRDCKFMGDTYAMIGDTTYHICEFAEKMERIGATYEPANQLVDIKLAPSVESADKYYSFNREEANTCAGSLHGDFGRDGDRYHAGWNTRDNGFYNSEIQSELQSAVYALRQDLLKDRDSMIAYCQNHPEAKLSEGKSKVALADGEVDYAIYGFKLETELRQYFINCFVQDVNSRFAIYAYSDKPTLSLEQDYGGKDSAIDAETVSKENISTKRGFVTKVSAVANESAASKDSGVYTSVLGAIEDGKKITAQKPPYEDKAQAQRKKMQEEL